MNDEKIATLPGIDWNAHAVLVSALERIPVGAEVVVLWREPDTGALHYNKNQLTLASTCVFAAALSNMAAKYMDRYWADADSE